MRKLYILYTIVLEEMRIWDKLGGCPFDTITYLYLNNDITKKEYEAIKANLIKNKPTPKLHKRFYESESFIKSDDPLKWWVEYKQGYGVHTRRQMRLFIMKMKRVSRYAKQREE